MIDSSPNDAIMIDSSNFIIDLNTRKNIDKVGMISSSNPSGFRLGSEQIRFDLQGLEIEDESGCADECTCNGACPVVDYGFNIHSSSQPRRRSSLVLASIALLAIVTVGIVTTTSEKQFLSLTKHYTEDDDYNDGLPSLLMDDDISSDEIDLEDNKKKRFTTEYEVTAAPPDHYTLLPKRIYSVIGLESSGTQFVAGIIRDALKLDHYREGSFSYGANAINNEQEDIQVQHFSLPWGSTCTASKNPPIVDVVLPSQCTRKNDELECIKMTEYLWGFSNWGGPTRYPPRYNLDIISHKEWFDLHGTEQYIVIVVRDPDISLKARMTSGHHCDDYNLARQEEAAGTDIIIDAINKYILEDGKKGRKVTKENYAFWHAKTFQHSSAEGNSRRLGGSNDAIRYHRSLLPSGNNVVLVSYESLMKLKGTYVQMMYKTLGISSDYMPHMKNGNKKHIHR